MTTITLYALFFDDIRILCLPIYADSIVYSFTTFVLVCFSVEIILHSFADRNYINSFFFWLDVISTLSLIFDIGWILQAMNYSKSTKAASLAKTSRAARVTRIIRIVRLVRLIRIVKLYK